MHISRVSAVNDSYQFTKTICGFNSLYLLCHPNRMVKYKLYRRQVYLAVS